MEQQLGLNSGGWIFITSAWAFIGILTFFCFKRVLGSQAKKK
ncbi:MAG: hypothetical protein ALAOOOJD_00723 [bacterium]|nr:hypothetical protein [bacterium]